MSQSMTSFSTLAAAAASWGRAQHRAGARASSMYHTMLRSLHWLKTTQVHVQYVPYQLERNEVVLAAGRMQHNRLFEGRTSVER